MYRTRLLFVLIYGCLTILLASACTNMPTIAPTAAATTAPELTQATAEAIIQGDTPGKEEVQKIELDNCGGKADAKRTEQRTQSIDVTISSEMAAKIGASAAVLTAEVQAAVGVAITPGLERSTSIELVAPPDTRMVFQLAWIGNEYIGIVQNIRNSDIPVAFRSFLPTDVHIRSQSDIGCSDSSAPQPVFEPTVSSILLNTVTPLPTLPPTSTTASPQPICSGSGEIPPTPNAPMTGCILIAEWWVPPDPSPCGIIISRSNVTVPENAIGTWWYVYQDRPDAHIQGFIQKHPHCEVQDNR